MRILDQIVISSLNEAPPKVSDSRDGTCRYRTISEALAILRYLNRCKRVTIISCKRQNYFWFFSWWSVKHQSQFLRKDRTEIQFWRHSNFWSFDLLYKMEVKFCFPRGLHKIRLFIFKLRFVVTWDRTNLRRLCTLVPGYVKQAWLERMLVPWLFREEKQHQKKKDQKNKRKVETIWIQEVGWGEGAGVKGKEKERGGLIRRGEEDDKKRGEDIKRGRKEREKVERSVSSNRVVPMLTLFALAKPTRRAS